MPFQLVMALIKHIINLKPSNLIWKTTALPWFPLHYLLYWLTPVGFSSLMFVTCIPLFFMLLCVLSFTTFFNCTPSCNFAITVIFVMIKNPGYLFSYGWNYWTGIQLEIYQPSQLTWLIWIYVQYVTKKSNKYIYTLNCDMCQYTFHTTCTLLTKTESDDFMQSGSQDLTCRICAESLFPFNHAVENEDFLNIWMNYIMHQYQIILKLCIRK